MRCEDVKDMRDVMSFISHMMPHCFGLILSKMPAGERRTYLRNMLKSMFEAGCAGMTEKEKDDLVADMFSKRTLIH